MIFVSVGPIFGANHKHTRKSIIEGVYHKYGRSFSEQCISVSSAVGRDVDFGKIENLYEAYADCAAEVGDYEQFFRDFWEVYKNVYKIRSGTILYLSEGQKTEMISFLQMLVYQ